MFLVVGGYRHVYSHGPNGGEPQESFTYQSSGEYYDGEGWQQTESLVTARAHFSLEEMCGSLVSIGGQSAELEYLDTVERLWSVWNSWLPADYLRLPQPRAHAGSAAVSGLGNLRAATRQIFTEILFRVLVEFQCHFQEIYSNQLKIVLLLHMKQFVLRDRLSVLCDRVTIHTKFDRVFFLEIENLTLEFCYLLAN